MESTAGAELGFQEIVTLKGIFGWSQNANVGASIGYGLDYTIGNIVVPPGKQLHWFIAFSGTAEDWRVSKWGIGGYIRDGVNVIVPDPSPDMVFKDLVVGQVWDGQP
jgi:hypothetical protein